MLRTASTVLTLCYLLALGSCAHSPKPDVPEGAPCRPAQDKEAKLDVVTLTYQADYNFAPEAGYVLPVGAEILSRPSIGVSVLRYLSGVTWHSEWSEGMPAAYWDFEDVFETTRFRDGAPEDVRDICDAVLRCLGEGLRMAGWRIAGNKAMSDGWQPSRISALVTLEFRLQNPSGGQAFNGGVDAYGSLAVITYYTDVSLDGVLSDEMTLRAAILDNTDASRVLEFTTADTELLISALNRLRLASTKGR